MQARLAVATRVFIDEGSGDTWMPSHEVLSDIHWLTGDKEIVVVVLATERISLTRMERSEWDKLIYLT